jgi:hypothetical protein
MSRYATNSYDPDAGYKFYKLQVSNINARTVFSHIWISYNSQFNWAMEKWLNTWQIEMAIILGDGRNNPYKMGDGRWVSPVDLTPAIVGTTGLRRCWGTLMQMGSWMLVLVTTTPAIMLLSHPNLPHYRGACPTCPCPPNVWHSHSSLAFHAIFLFGFIDPKCSVSIECVRFGCFVGTVCAISAFQNICDWCTVYVNNLI